MTSSVGVFLPIVAVGFFGFALTLTKRKYILLNIIFLLNNVTNTPETPYNYYI